VNCRTKASLSVDLRVNANMSVGLSRLAHTSPCIKHALYYFHLNKYALDTIESDACCRSCYAYICFRIAHKLYRHFWPYILITSWLIYSAAVNFFHYRPNFLFIPIIEYIVAYLPKVRLLSHRNLERHATIEARVFISHCWVTHATVERVAAPRLTCCYATQR
jgi:hypothetical protein